MIRYRRTLTALGVAMLCAGGAFLQPADRAEALKRDGGAAGRIGSALGVKLKSPNGGEVWKSGEKRTITWAIQDGTGVAGVIIRFSRTPGSALEDVASLPGNPGSYEWQVPKVSSKDCRVLIEVFDGSGSRAGDESDSAFTIQATDAKPDLAASLKSSALLAPNQELSITVTIRNRGDGPAPESDVDIIIRNGHAPRQVVRTFTRKIRALDPADEFSFSFPIKLSLGSYEICGTADRRKKIPDADRKNNGSCITIEGI